MVNITTKQQFDILIEEMQANPNVARGVRLFGETKATTDEVWKSIAMKLNSYGPPTRTPDEWQRVWVHFKAKLKKKIAQNKRNINVTGGGPSQEVSLSPLEQTAANSSTELIIIKNKMFIVEIFFFVLNCLFVPFLY